MNNSINRERLHKLAARDQNVLLLSLADMVGASVFTRWEPLLLISRPWKRPRGSCCIVSGRACAWLATSIEWWVVDMLDWRGWYCAICIFRESLGPDCGWCEENKVDWLYGICCIPKLYASEGAAISPVAILSLSTSCFSASFKAAFWNR